jgi:hypothetical protein
MENSSVPSALTVLFSRRLRDPRVVAWACVFLALVAAVFTQCRGVNIRKNGFLVRILFSRNFEERQLPEVRAMRPPMRPTGFDGQFYAQLAIDPLLRHPGMMAAMDNPKYRARRIFVPALSWLLGLGRPVWAVHAYSVVNLLAWFVLAALAVRWCAPYPAAVIALLPLLAGVGVMFSIERALLDLPTACWIAGTLLAARAGSLPVAALCLASGCLTRETAVVALPVLAVVPISQGKAALPRRILWGTVAVLPFALWGLYVERQFAGAEQGLGGSSVGPPLVAMFRQIGECAGRLSMEWNLTCLQSLGYAFALSVQALWFLRRPERWRDPAWLVGLCYALFFACMGHQSWMNGGMAVCRTLLPLTVAFHFTLMRERLSPAWWAWLVAANLSLPFALERH